MQYTCFYDTRCWWYHCWIKNYRKEKKNSLLWPNSTWWSLWKSIIFAFSIKNVGFTGSYTFDCCIFPNYDPPHCHHATLCSHPPLCLVVTQEKGNVCIFMAVIFDQIPSGFPRTGPGSVRERAGCLPLLFRARLNSRILDKPVTLISTRIFKLVMWAR